jgi:hypothetical protein
MKCFAKILLPIALVVLPLAAASPAHAAKKMEVAVQDDGVFLYQDYYNRDTAFRQLRDLGASQLRIQLGWHQAMPADQANSRTKPRPVNYDFSRWDSAVARAKAFGMKVQLVLTGYPPLWACGKRADSPYDCRGFKPKLRPYKQFAKLAAKHFKGKVNRFSIWNEPNWYTWLSPHKNSPRLYRNLYRAGYTGVKKGNKRAKVLMGELAPYAQKRRAIAPLKFLREMVCVNKRFKRIKGARKKCPGKALKLDGFAHHPYDFTRPPAKRRKGRDNVTMANLGALTKTLDTLRKKRLLKPSVKKVPVYLTEHGYFVKGPRRVSETKRKRWTRKAFTIAQKNPRVKQMLYYVFVSPPADSPWSFFDLGLIDQDGKPRGAFNALRKWVRSAARDGRVKKPGRCQASVVC